MIKDILTEKDLYKCCENAVKKLQITSDNNVDELTLMCSIDLELLYFIDIKNMTHITLTNVKNGRCEIKFEGFSNEILNKRFVFQKAIL